MSTAFLVAMLGLFGLYARVLTVRVEPWLGAALRPLAVAEARVAPDAPPERLAVAARGLQVRDLGRALATDDPLVRQDRLEHLYVFATSRAIREDALLALLSDALWPDDFRGDFLAGIAPEVLRTARKYRLPPSITLAQAILESGWGRSSLTRRHGNLFGVKAGTSAERVSLPTREFKRGKLRPDRRNYRVYDSQDDSIRHHARVLAKDRRYRKARKAWTDWYAFLVTIAPRYASSPTYVDRIAGLVVMYELDRWDDLNIRAVEKDERRRHRVCPVEPIAEGGDTGEPEAG